MCGGSLGQFLVGVFMPLPDVCRLQGTTRRELAISSVCVRFRDDSMRWVTPASSQRSVLAASRVESVTSGAGPLQRGCRRQLRPYGRPSRRPRSVGGIHRAAGPTRQEAALRISRMPQRRHHVGGRRGGRRRGLPTASLHMTEQGNPAPGTDRVEADPGRPLSSVRQSRGSSLVIRCRSRFLSRLEPRPHVHFDDDTGDLNSIDRPRGYPDQRAELDR